MTISERLEAEAAEAEAAKERQRKVLLTTLARGPRTIEDLVRATQWEGGVWVVRSMLRELERQRQVHLRGDTWQLGTLQAPVPPPPADDTAERDARIEGDILRLLGGGAWRWPMEVVGQIPGTFGRVRRVLERLVAEGRIEEGRDGRVRAREIEAAGAASGATEPPRLPSSSERLVEAMASEGSHDDGRPGPLVQAGGEPRLEDTQPAAEGPPVGVASEGAELQVALPSNQGVCPVQTQAVDVRVHEMPPKPLGSLKGTASDGTSAMEPESLPTTGESVEVRQPDLPQEDAASGPGGAARSRGDGVTASTADTPSDIATPSPPPPSAPVDRPPAATEGGGFAVDRSTHKEFDMSKPDLLAYVRAHPRCTAAEVRQATGIETAAVGLAQLHAAGRLSRTGAGGRTDPFAYFDPDTLTPSSPASPELSPTPPALPSTPPASGAAVIRCEVCGFDGEGEGDDPRVVNHYRADQSGSRTCALAVSRYLHGDEAAGERAIRQATADGVVGYMRRRDEDAHRELGSLHEEVTAALAERDEARKETGHARRIIEDIRARGERAEQVLEAIWRMIGRRGDWDYRDVERAVHGHLEAMGEAALRDVRELEELRATVGRMRVEPAGEEAAAGRIDAVRRLAGPWEADPERLVRLAWGREAVAVERVGDEWVAECSELGAADVDAVVVRLGDLRRVQDIADAALRSLGWELAETERSEPVPL